MRKIGISSEEYVKIRQYYGNEVFRGRKWLIRLRNAKKGDIVVMHPGHAYRIAPLLGIDRKKIVWLDTPTKLLAEAKKWLHPKRVGKFMKLRSLVRNDRRLALKKPK